MGIQRLFLSLGFILSVPLLLLVVANPSWAGVDCGDTIGPNKIAYLKKDILNCAASPAIKVEDNTILFLSGHEVACDGDGVGIQMNGSGSRVENGTVTNCSEGVLVGGTGGHIVTKVTAAQNFIGFFIFPGTRGNRFTFNHARENRDFGFFIEQSHENKFSWNTSENNGSVTQGGSTGGGYLLFGGNGNTFKYNLAKNSLTVGFVSSGNDNTFIKNRMLLTKEGPGFNFFLSERTTVFANFSKDNKGDGFGLNGADYKFVGNWAKNNGGRGIDMGGQDSKLVGNVALGNATDLFDQNVDCDNNTWKFNLFKTRNQDCIR